MKRSVEEIRENMDYVGCDNATALEMCDEIDRLTADLKLANAKAAYWERKDYCPACAKRMRDGEPVATVRQARLCPKCGQPGEMFTADLDWCPACGHQWPGT